jgi:signal recognition particle subunit SRP54
MFEVLSDKLSAVFRKLSSRGKLGEDDIDDTLRQVRVALLEAGEAWTPSSRNYSA